ncbi:hypothetical protein ACE6H2_017819 [Prunus campanulata]
MTSFYSKFIFAKIKIKYVACPNQQVGVIVAKINPADLKKIGVNAVDSFGENGGVDKEKIFSKVNSSITALGFFKRGLKETLLAIAENEDAKWKRSKGCGFTAAEQQTLQECKILLEKQVQPDLKTDLGPRPPAPPKVPRVPVIESHREGGKDKEGAKKPVNGNGSRNVCENEGAVKASREGATSCGGGHNGKHSEGSSAKPDGEVAGDNGGNVDGVTEGGGEDGILGKLLEKLNEVFGG